MILSKTTCRPVHHVLFERTIFRNSFQSGTEFIVFDENSTWWHLWRIVQIKNTRVWETQDRVGIFDDLETHQKKVGFDFHRLKTMVKRSIEQDSRNDNFGARNGNYERNAVVNNQGTKPAWPGWWGLQGMRWTGGGGLVRVPNQRVCVHLLVPGWDTQEREGWIDILPWHRLVGVAKTSSETQRRKSRAARKGKWSPRGQGTDRPHQSCKCAQVAGKAGENAVVCFYVSHAQGASQPRSFHESTNFNVGDETNHVRTGPTRCRPWCTSRAR